MRRQPTFSLIVPTRERSTQLRRFLASIASTAAYPDGIEVVLVVDSNDPVSIAVRHPGLFVRHVIVPPRQTMGFLNLAGYEASAGAYVMLLNDDVIARTPGWDTIARACFRSFPDPIVLVHFNDTLFRDRLCTFPLLSRTFCKATSGICPSEYIRYRIDDHIEDLFNLLAVLGARRTVYLPDVVFEHLNTVEHPDGTRVYESDTDILALDARHFEALFPARKELALRLLEFIEGGADPEVTVARRRVLDGLTDPFALRTAGRQCVVRLPWWRRSQNLIRLTAGFFARARRKGYRGLARALGRRFLRLISREPVGEPEPRAPLPGRG